MRASPPERLIELLESLGLATARQLARARRHVRRLAGKSAAFDSVWIDALVQDRVLTLYQAGRIIRDEGSQLRVGPFVLLEPVYQLGRLTACRAREVETGLEFRLLRCEATSDLRPAIAARLEQLVEHKERFPADCFAPCSHSGECGAQVWAAHRAVPGETAADWICRHGRFPPDAVLGIAVQMVTGLASLERAGAVHGDLSPRELTITADGRAIMTAPGFRAAVLPNEGYQGADLPPEAFDSAAPEQVASAAPPTAASDRFALGVLWWHLLAGRSPWPAGDSLARMRAIEKARLPRIRYIVPDTPEPLARAIEQCTFREPEQRPDSYEAIVELLAAAPAPARRRIASSLVPSLRTESSWEWVLSTFRPTWRSAAGAMTLAASLLLLALVFKSAVTERPAIQQTVALAAESSHPSKAAAPAKARLPAGASPAASRPREQVAAVDFARGGEVVSESRVERSGGTPELLLPTDRPLRLATLHLVPGQIVRGSGGGRVTILGPPEGITIDVENVRFVDVDFVAEAESRPARENPSYRRQTSLLHLRAFQAAFQRCSFSGSGSLDQTVIAVDWDTAALADRAALELPNGQLECKDCVFSDVSAGVRCRFTGAMAILFDNTLHLGPGPLVRLSRAPQLDEPMNLKLVHVTVREAASLLEIRSEQSSAESGGIAVTALECVFALRAGGSLLQFVTPQLPSRLVGTIQWNGEGSVMTAHGGLATWLAADGKRTPLDVSRLRAAGLVQSGIDFAGPSRSAPSASQAVRWQVPLRSPDPPGIDESRLPKVRSKRT